MNIRDFPLAWRWTDPRYAVFPAHALAGIHPLQPEQAEKLFQQRLAFCGPEGLSKERFALAELATGDREESSVSKWLLSQHADRDTRVFVSWLPDVAAETTWGIFAEYWSDFCYPASDDVLVWHDAAAWALHYHHEQLFQFGTPRRG